MSGPADSAENADSEGVEAGSGDSNPTPEALDPYRVHADGIDDDMKRLQWLNWALEGERGKVPKRPDNPRRNARSNDATTWGTFTDALENAEGRDLGVGLPLAQASPFTALDIDIPDGDEWVPGFGGLGGAVVERSPTGNRRVLLRDVEVPEWWSNQGEAGPDTREVKVFDDSGYVATTGDILDGHGPPIGETSQGAFAAWLREAWRAFHDEDDLKPWEDPEPDSGEPRGAQSTTAGGGDWFDTDVAREALDYVDPDIGHDDWVVIGYALNDQFPEATAKQLFEEWSRGGSKWEENADGEIGSIFESDKGTGADVRALVNYAKEGGWDASAAARSASSRSEGRQRLMDGANDHHRDEEDYGEGPWKDVRAWLRTEDADNGRAYVRAVELLFDDKWPGDRGPLDHPVLTERETASKLVYNANSGVFESHGELPLRRHLVENLGDTYRTNREREIVAQIAGRTETPIEEIGGPEGLLCVANGVLDLRDLPDGDPELVDHSPEYRFQRAVTAPFDPEADCPRFKKFLGEVVRPDDIETLQEFAGYTLMHWGQPFKRAALLLGPKDSGKSTYLDIIVAMLGRENVSSENLDSLVNSRWGVAETHRKFANVTNELDTNALQSLGKFKTLVGGDAQITAERKRENKFRFRPTAKHMFATNQVPPAKDADDAFHERWLHILFPKSVPKHEQVKGLDEEIVADELPGILNWAIDGYRRLIEQAGFSNDPLVGAKREQWESYGNSINRFKHNCLEVTGDPDDVIVKGIAYGCYSAFCQWAGAPAETQSMLTRNLKKDAKITDGRRKAHPDDKRRTAYVGVRFEQVALEELDFNPGEELNRLRDDAGDDTHEPIGGLDEFADE